MTKIFFLLLVVLAFSSFGQAGETLTDLSSKLANVDTDGDGKTDLWRSFSPTGDLKEAKYDLNGDGKEDKWVLYGVGNTRKEADTNFDGVKDERETKLYNDDGMIKSTLEKLNQNKWEVVEEVEVKRSGQKAQKFLVKKFSAGKLIEEKLLDTIID
ncbi:MAG: hypothetical protein A2X86_01910 [Bdellovibrionales bacterium GWA2_49_15]|nr:MAG: hypothetical protein A2X86_01910 [Bdellovibrionales bacterium GWA2_49_15]